MSIQSEINRIAGAKSDIADAIEDMGGTLSPGASIDDLAAGVRTIPQGSGGTTDANHVTYDSSETYDSGTVGAALNEQRNTLNQHDQNMAYVESGNTASRNYSVGKFISWKGTLYTANDTISSGQSFTIGTGGNLLAVVDGNGNLCGGLNALNTKWAVNITANSKTAFENKLNTFINSMYVGETRIGFFYPNYSGSMTGGSNSPGMITRLRNGSASVFFVINLVYGYYYDSAWHWYKPTVSPIT